MRALVTGASGFVGRRVIAALRDANFEFLAIGRTADGDELSRALGPAPWSANQLARLFDEFRPDTIFHLAGARDGVKADLKEINVGLLRSITHAIKVTEQKPTLIVSGSAAEYGAALVDGEPIDESARCRPTSDYGATKLAQTEMLMSFSQATGSRGVAARIFTAIGPGMPSHMSLGSFAQQINACVGGEGEVVTGDVEVKRDFLSVDVVAGAFVSLALTPAASGIVNICSGEPIEVRRLLETMIAHSGKKMNIRVDPARMRPGELKVIIGSIRKLRSFGIHAPTANIDSVAKSMINI